MPSYKVPVKKQRSEELIYDDRMRKIEREYAALGYVYALDRDEKEALEFERWKQKFKSTYSYFLHNAFRIKHRNEEFLVYRVNEEVIDNNNRVHKCDRQVGWRTSPIAETTTVDEFGEAKDLRIVGRKLIYEIPFDKEFLRDLIEKSKEPPMNTCVGRGNDSPHDIMNSNPQTVFNIEEFIEADFEDLFGASQGGFLKPEIGGVKAYQQSRKSPQQ